MFAIIMISTTAQHGLPQGAPYPGRTIMVTKTANEARPRTAKRATTKEAAPRVAVQGIAPFLGSDSDAEEAARFYVSLFKGSRVVRADEMSVELNLAAQGVHALNGGPHYKLTPAFSMSVLVRTQARCGRSTSRPLTRQRAEGKPGCTRATGSQIASARAPRCGPPLGTMRPRETGSLRQRNRPSGGRCADRAGTTRAGACRVRCVVAVTRNGDDRGFTRAPKAEASSAPRCTIRIRCGFLPSAPPGFRARRGSGSRLRPWRV